MRHGSRTPTRLLLVRRTSDRPPQATPGARRHRRTFSYLLPEGAEPTVVEDEPAETCPIGLAEATSAPPGTTPEPTLKWELMGCCALIHDRRVR